MPLKNGQRNMTNKDTIDKMTGLSKDQSYLEKGLPPFLQESIRIMQETWDRLDRGETCMYWDCDYCSLQSDINNAEVNLVITPEQAWYLREKYLRMKRLDLGKIGYEEAPE